MRKRSFNSQGFTLIEVLVASVILFASIAMVSLIYRGAFLSSERAEKHITSAGVIPLILSTIRENIRENGHTQEDQLSSESYAWEVRYRWKAEVVDLKSAPIRLDVDTGDYVTPPMKYRLWKVELTTIYKTTKRYYQFHELSWTND